MQKHVVPETSPSPWPLTRVGLKGWAWAFVFGLAIRWSFVLFAHHELSWWAAVAVTAPTLGAGVMCFHSMWRWIGGLDELQRAMQLKAFALVFPGFLLIVVACDQLRAAGVIDGVTWQVEQAGFSMLAVYGAAWTWLWWRNR